MELLIEQINYITLFIALSFAVLQYLAEHSNTYFCSFSAKLGRFCEFWGISPLLHTETLLQSLSRRFTTS